jgi:hypothetical protein
MPSRETTQVCVLPLPPLLPVDPPDADELPPLPVVCLLLDEVVG